MLYLPSIVLAATVWIAVALADQVDIDDPMFSPCRHANTYQGEIDPYFTLAGSEDGTLLPPQPGGYGNGNNAGGRFSLNWNRESNFCNGKGWKPGSSSRTINYQGSYLFTGNTSLSVYGWTRNPIVEYKIVNAYSGASPASNTVRRGSVYCNGFNYDIFSVTRYNTTSIDGLQTFPSFSSIRNPNVGPSSSTTGQVDVACHFNAWRNYGMNLGSQHNYQVVAVSGQVGGVGSATITVSQA